MSYCALKLGIIEKLKAFVKCQAQLSYMGEKKMQEMVKLNTFICSNALNNLL